MIENISLLTMLEDIPLGMILLNEKGHIITANKTFLQTFSFKLENVSGKAAEKILSFPSKDKKTAPFFLSEKPSSQKQIAEIKDGKGKVYRVEFRAYDPGKGHEVFYAGFISGTGEFDYLRNELKRQVKINDSIKDELDEETELSALKSRFLSIASHEFKTPLAGILSSLNLIKRYLEADAETWSHFKNREKVANHLGKINESVKNLTTILDRFLALGNIEQGEIPLRMAHFNIVNAFKKQSAQFRELCKPGQKILYRHNSQETSVYLDKNLLRNIMNNLFSNAIRYSPENSEIKLLTEVTPEEIRIELADEGIGIPQADQKNVFRRFYRARNSLTLQDGTGLGLSIVRKYVEQMKGDISFDSEENKGTTFYISFPNKAL